VPANDPKGLRFGEVADAYERGRPSYPAPIIDWLLSSTPNRVVDLGAGTGKLTRALVGRVGAVIAVEPDPGMRAALATVLPGVPVLAGTGEQIPLPDRCVDAVIAAQAWHWVDATIAVPEVARILAPGGMLGLVWNDRDESDPWVAVLTDMLDDFGTNPDSEYEPVVGLPFGPLDRTEVRWTCGMTVEGVVDMIASRSYVIALGASERDDLVSRVRAHAQAAAATSAGLVPVRYVTRGYRSWLLP
jgi:SAM-dependent methyltransferase